MPYYEPSGAVSVGIASTFLLPDNAFRRRILFINDSLTTIYLRKGSPAIVGSGIRLNASGGNYEDLPDTRGYIYTGVWTAITTVAAQNLAYTEE